MPLCKEDTVDQFFPKPAEELAETACVPESLVKHKFWRIICFFRLLWSVTVHTTIAFLVLCVALGIGSQSPTIGRFTPPVMFSKGLPICFGITESSKVSLDTLAAHIEVLESSLDTLHTLSVRTTAMESRLDSLNKLYSPAADTKSHLDNLSALVADLKTRIDALDMLLRSPPPRNFARRAEGARFIKALTSPAYNDQSNGFFQYFRFKNGPKVIPPSLVLDDTASSYCWEFAGSRGQLGIRLSEETHVASLSINHAHPRSISSLSAGKVPRAFALWGLYTHAASIPVDIPTQSASDFLLLSPSSDDVSLTETFVFLTNGTYNVSSSNTHQYFNVPPSIRSALRFPFRIVLLEVLDNWGSNTTCLYSVGIHDEVVE